MKKVIKTLRELNGVLGEISLEISPYCSTCTEHDCAGYTWLLPEETEELFELGVPLVQVNSGPTFIHSFQTKQDGSLDLSARYPSCSQLCDGSARGCSIYHARPFVCRLYPLGFEVEHDGSVVWALHKDCLFIKTLEQEKRLHQYEEKMREIIATIDKNLMDTIRATALSVHEISIFESGNNNYSILCYV